MVVDGLRRGGGKTALPCLLCGILCIIVSWTVSFHLHRGLLRVPRCSRSSSSHLLYGLLERSYWAALREWTCERGSSSHLQPYALAKLRARSALSCCTLRVVARVIVWKLIDGRQQRHCVSGRAEGGGWAGLIEALCDRKGQL